MGEYWRPRTLDEALDARARGARIIAGATDVLPLHVERPLHRDPMPMLDLTAIPSLAGIVSSDHGLRIGAATTWSEIAEARLPTHLRALQQAAREVGGRQIQNRATIGGNLVNASPAADGVPPLLALDAELELVSRRGMRRMPVAEFIIGPRRTALGPDEILSAIVIPEAGGETRSHFLKLGARAYLVISIVMVAGVIEFDASRIARARLAVGACSPVARRLPALESALGGLPAAALGDFSVTDAHLAGLAPITDVRASAAYRMDAARTMTERLLAALAEDRP